jgi:hypothetical protein
MRFTTEYQVPRERLAEQEAGDRDGDDPAERRLRILRLTMLGVGDMEEAGG